MIFYHHFLRNLSFQMMLSSEHRYKAKGDTLKHVDHKDPLIGERIRETETVDASVKLHRKMYEQFFLKTDIIFVEH